MKYIIIFAFVFASCFYGSNDFKNEEKRTASSAHVANENLETKFNFLLSKLNPSEKAIYDQEKKLLQESMICAIPVICSAVTFFAVINCINGKSCDQDFTGNYPTLTSMCIANTLAYFRQNENRQLYFISSTQAHLMVSLSVLSCLAFCSGFYDTALSFSATQLMFSLYEGAKTAIALNKTIAKVTDILRRKAELLEE